MSLPLLQTKLYLPPARPNLVQRFHLIERLNAGGIETLSGRGEHILLQGWLDGQLDP